MRSSRGRAIPTPPFKMGQLTPVRVNSLNQQPTPPFSSSKTTPAYEEMQKHLLRLEKGLSDAMRKLAEQADANEKDKEKASYLEVECVRMTRIVNEIELKRIGMKDVGVQTVVISAPAPLTLSVRRNLPTTRNFVQAPPSRDILSPETPEPVKCEKENIACCSVVIPPAVSFKNKNQATESGTGVTALRVLQDFTEKRDTVSEKVLAQFDKLDGKNLKALPRDTCLLMASLLLEEMGIRHAAIPKVICSRMLKSVTQSTDGLTLKRDAAPEFFQKVLQFIIEQER